MMEYFLFTLSTFILFATGTCHYVYFAATSVIFTKWVRKKKKTSKIFISRRFPVQAIIWKASINWSFRLVHGNRKSPPKKEQDGIRPHTPKVKRVREISWISPTKTRFVAKRRRSKSCWKTIHKRTQLMAQTWNFTIFNGENSR